MANYEYLDSKSVKQKIKKNLILSVLIINSVSLLSACSHLPDWMGEAKKDSGIKGTRISVLNLDTTTSADSALNELKVSIPHPMPNGGWYKSGGRPYIVADNIELSQPLDSIVNVSAGSGVGDGQHIKAAPVIAEGKVFTISPDGKISAFDAPNIKKNIWSQKLKVDNKDEKLSSTAGITYYKGKIYVATGYNEVDALDASTGNVIWAKNVNSIARAAPDVKDNAVFINTIDNRLYALDAADGSILWSHSGSTEDLSMFGSASPVVYENMVIVPYSSGEVYSLQIIDGREIWSDVFARRSIGAVKMLSDIDASPVISNGRAFVISNDGVLAAVDMKTGKRMWEQPVSGRQSPWVSGDFLYLITNKNEIACVYAKSGGIKWVKQLQTYKHADSKKDPITWSGPVMADNLLWIVSSHGKLTALSPIDGEEKYERKVPKDIYIAPVIAGGYMYLYSDDAELIEVSNGNIKNYKEVEKPVENKEEKKPNLKPSTSIEDTKIILHKVASGAAIATNKMVDGVKSLFGSKKTDAE